MTMGEEKIRVLIVDDNTQYREALKRMLQIEDYDVHEAEDLMDGLRCIQEESPDVVVTDLQMRTDTEGLDLIEIAKGYDPVLPVIMISAVGSFEEGAKATQLGAVHVIHKSRIEEELDSLLSCIRDSYQAASKSRELLALIASARLVEEQEDGDETAATIKALLANPDVDPYVKGEAYDFMASRNTGEFLRENEVEMQQTSETGHYKESCESVITKLQETLPSYNAMSEEARRALTTAEYMYETQDSPDALDFSRTIAFSYCFAVESEARVKLKGKTTRLASNRANQRIMDACVDPKSKRLEMLFQQDVLMASRQKGIKFTMDNVRQLVLRIVKREGKFKTDGLKDVGLILLCFGRHYTLRKWGQDVKVDNPLKVKGLKSDAEVIELAGQLIALQYARNPYIHPDGLKREQLSVLRQTALDSLAGIGRLS